MVTGLDNWQTTARIQNPGIDPQIVLEARNRTMFVLLGNWNVQQARAVAQHILAACDEAEANRAHD